MSPDDETRRRGARPLPSEEGPDPRPLGSAIDAYLKTTTMGSAQTVAALGERWAEIAGEEVARHCRPAALSDGILVIHVDHPAWATQLRLLLPEILERAARLLGEGQIRAAKVHVRGGIGVD